MSSRYLDLDVRFEWKDHSCEGFYKVFSPNFLHSHEDKYISGSINIAVIRGPEQKLPNKYDLVCFRNFLADPETLTFIRDRCKAVEFSMCDIRSSVYSGRISNLNFFADVVRKYNVPYVFTSGATNIYEVKSPKEICFAGESIGFTQKQVLLSLSNTAGKIVGDL